jgi:hypothetical protein
VVGGAAGDVDEAVGRVRPGAQPRDGSLEQVAEAVQLVTPLEVAVARALSRPTSQAIASRSL